MSTLCPAGLRLGQRCHLDPHKEGITVHVIFLHSPGPGCFKRMHFKREIRLSSQSVVPERSHIAAKMKKTYQLYKYTSHEVLNFFFQEKNVCAGFL